MWRFIVVTFAFLGWSFYELSGGSDYEPRIQSLQARAKLDNQRPIARPVRVNVIQLADDGPPQAVTRSLRSLANLDLSGGKRFEITLASVNVERQEASIATTGVSEPDIPDLPVAKMTPVPAPEASETRVSDVPAETGATPDISESIQAAVDSLSLAGLSAEAEGLGAATGEDIRRVSGNVVNLRGGPGTRYARVARLTKGTEVLVLRNPEDGWLKLRVVETGRVGWMAQRLVTAAN